MKVLTFLFIAVIALLFCSNRSLDITDQSSLKYNKENHTESGNPQKYLLRKFTKYHFSLLYPSNWIIDTKERQLLFVCKDQCTHKSKFCLNFVVNVIPKKSDVSLEQYTSVLTQNILNKFEKVKLVNSVPTSINGLEAVVIDYKMFTEGLHLGGTTALIIIKGNIVSINCTGENEQEGSYLNHRKIFEVVIKSVKSI